MPIAGLSSRYWKRTDEGWFHVWHWLKNVMNYYWLSASNDKVSTFFVDFIDFKADLCGGIIRTNLFGNRLGFRRGCTCRCCRSIGKMKNISIIDIERCWICGLLSLALLVVEKYKKTDCKTPSRYCATEVGECPPRLKKSILKAIVFQRMHHQRML